MARRAHAFGMPSCTECGQRVEQGRDPDEGRFVAGGIRRERVRRRTAWRACWRRAAGPRRFERGFRAGDVMLRSTTRSGGDLPSPPFVDRPRVRGAVWAERRLETEVSCAEIVDGSLRAPRWRGLV